MEAFRSGEKVRVAPCDLSSSLFDIRYHPSLRPHIINHGLAMLAYLESRLRALKRVVNSKFGFVGVVAC